MFKPHKGVCCNCDKQRIIVVKSGYCGVCNELKKGKKPYKIKSRSKAMSKKMVEYNERREKFLVGKICPVTNKPATQVHHKRGRTGKYLLDERYWLGVTQEGHQKIEENPEWAKEMGYSETRLGK